MMERISVSFTSTLTLLLIPVLPGIYCLISFYYTLRKLLYSCVYRNIDNDDAIYLYEAYTNKPTKIESLAPLISPSYRHSDSEFSQHKMLTSQLSYYIQRQIQSAKKLNWVKISTTIELEAYDFNSLSFPTGCNNSSLFHFYHNYASKFSITPSIEHLPISLFKAIFYTPLLFFSRKGTLTIYAEVSGEAEEIKMGVKQYKVLSLTAKAISFTHSTGLNLGFVKLTNHPEFSSTPVTGGEQV